MQRIVNAIRNIYNELKWNKKGITINNKSRLIRKQGLT